MSYPAFEKKLQERLSKATVGEVCTRPCEYLAETDHLETALTKLRTLKLYSLPLVNANMEQGISHPCWGLGAASMRFLRLRFMNLLPLALSRSPLASMML